jgi:hypothetical protein
MARTSEEVRTERELRLAQLRARRRNIVKMLESVDAAIALESETIAELDRQPPP